MPSAVAQLARVKTSRLFRTLFFGLILLMTVVLASVIMETAALDVREKLDNAVRLERDLGLLYATLLEAESGQRGYLLTRDETYLAPYRNAITSINPILARVSKEVRTDSLQQARLQYVHRLTDRKFEEMDKTLAYDVERDSSSLRQLLSSNLGLDLMDQIRTNIDQLREEEARDVARRQQQVKQLTSITTVLRFLGVLGLAGAFFYIFTQLRPLFADILQAVASRDAEIEERKRVEVVNNALIADLNVKNRELDQFAYIASHDLREPLRTVNNFVELITEEYGQQFDAEGREHLNFIQRATARMSVLIDSLLLYSRIGRGESPTPVDLDLTTREALENLAYLVEESGAEVQLHGLPSLIGYPIALRQLLQNLLANALKFHAPGAAPRVEVFGERSGNDVRFSVRDHGIGMSDEGQTKIFELFTRLNSKENHEGQGIGLAFCQKIVQLHQGTIQVESRLGLGSTFTVQLPGIVNDEKVREHTVG